MKSVYPTRFFCRALKIKVEGRRIEGTVVWCIMAMGAQFHIVQGQWLQIEL